MKKKLILKTFLLSIIFNVSSLYSQEELSVSVDNIKYIVSDFDSDSDYPMTYTSADLFCRSKSMILPSDKVLMAMYNELYKEKKGNFCACFYWSSTKDDDNKAISIDFASDRGALIHNENIEKYEIKNYVRCVVKSISIF